MLPEVTQWTGLLVAFPLLGATLLVALAWSRLTRSSLADARAALADARADALEDRKRYQRDRKSDGVRLTAMETALTRQMERCDALEDLNARLVAALRNAGISWPG